MREPLRSHKITRGFVLLTAVFVAVLAGLVVQIVANRNLSKQGEEAHDALCVLKMDLQRRYSASLDFISKNPNGIPGIPVQVFYNSLANQKASIDSLARLDCVPPPPPKEAP